MRIRLEYLCRGHDQEEVRTAARRDHRNLRASKASRYPKSLWMPTLAVDYPGGSESEQVTKLGSSAAVRSWFIDRQPL